MQVRDDASSFGSMVEVLRETGVPPVGLIRQVGHLALSSM